MCPFDELFALLRTVTPSVPIIMSALMIPSSSVQVLWFLYKIITASPGWIFEKYPSVIPRLEHPKLKKTLIIHIAISEAVYEPY